ncbi:hypothetical protein RIF29_25629 [Crotalaria pallida]|uniref:Uncharacterized protein n=1 Tax=Crotalaria pallida TaxID=3830 RepID=A0AAN9HZY0_CROPI
MRMSYLVSGVAQLSDIIGKLASLPAFVTHAKDTFSAPFPTDLADGLGNFGLGLLSHTFPPFLPALPLYPTTYVAVIARSVATTLPCQNLSIDFNVALDLPVVGLKRNYSDISSMANVVQPTVPICESSEIEVVSSNIVTSSAPRYQTFVFVITHTPSLPPSLPPLFVFTIHHSNP